MNVPGENAKKKRYDVDAIKNRLNAYRDKEREIDVKVERLDTLVSKMKSIGSPEMSDMPKAPGMSSEKKSSKMQSPPQLQNSG